MNIFEEILANLLNPDSFYSVYLKFPLELAIAGWLFTYKGKKRSHWLFRTIVAYSIVLLASLLWPQAWTGLVEMVKYLWLFALMVGCNYSVFEMSFWEALYRGTAAYATQHIANSMVGIFQYILTGFFSVSLGKLNGIFVTISYILIEFLSYLLINLLFASKMRKDGFYDVENHVFVVFVSLVLLFVIVLNFCHVIFVPWTEDYLVAQILLELYAMLCCIFSLYVQAGLHRQSRLSQQLEIADQLIHQQEKQYRLSNETIQTINIKCHDLKHQIAALRQSMNDPLSQNALAEIESATQIYDSSVKTGNPALDTILTEKRLLCENKNIQLTCMVDANGLSSISDPDLYAIFGNLLDNAIEGVLELTEPKKRVISLTVFTKGNLLVIHIENYFDHPIELKDGLPVTTKEDTRFHGFGMKSLRVLAERYGGVLTVDPSDDIFNVDMIFPLTHG